MNTVNNSSQIALYKELFSLSEFDASREACKGSSIRLVIVDIFGDPIILEDGLLTSPIPPQIQVFEVIEQLMKSHFISPLIAQISPLAIVKSSTEELVFMVMLSGEIRKKTSERTGELSAIEQQLYALCKDRVERAQYPLPLHETTASESLGWRLIVHRYLVKPLYYVGSNLLIRRYVKRFAASLFSSQQGRRICDIACGYDDLALEVAMQMNADVLMNDTTSKAQFYHAKKRAYTKVVYTVQNAIDLVLKKPFDLLLCKNVIHHMETREEMHALLVSISKNAENVIIIDPCDPRSTFLGKFWNNYYSSFLLDQGHSFLRLDEFQKEVELVFKDQKVFFKRMWTVKGPFMIATIQRSADTEEVH
jgi:hypothetical protein